VCVHVFGDSHLAEKAQSVQQASDARNIMCAAKPRHGRHCTAAAKEVQEQLPNAQNTKKRSIGSNDGVGDGDTDAIRPGVMLNCRLRALVDFIEQGGVFNAWPLAR